MIKSLILFLLCAQFVFAGGWPRKKGSAFIKFETRFLSAKHTYLSNGELSARFGTTRIFTNSMYAEYGVTNSVTAIAYVPFYQKLIRNNIAYSNGTTIEGAENGGFADMALGLRIGLPSGGKTVFALRVQADLPTGDASSETVLYTGDDEFNTSVALEFGRSFSGGKHYLTGDVGYNLRGEDRFGADMTNEVLFAVEYGRWLSRDFLAAVKTRGVFPAEIGSTVSEFGQSQYFAYTLEAYYKTSETLGVSASFTGATAVKNYFKSPVYALGLILSL